MRYRFIGTYTHGRTSLTICGVTFVEREPSECDDWRIANHPEFERAQEATPAPAVEAAPKKRGRPRKAH